MRVLYISRSYLTDSDFPLLREYQQQGIHVDAYFYGGNGSAGIIEIKKTWWRYGIFNASSYGSIKRMYNNYIDLKNLHFISLINSKPGKFFRILIMYYLLFKFKLKKYDVVHFTWPLEGKEEQILYRVNAFKILTIHDSIPHSGQEKQEIDRKIAFCNCDSFVLLSSSLVNEFSISYNIPLEKIKVNKMGEFDYLNYLKTTERPSKEKYILFFGRIVPHKGLEYLLEAMIKVHKEAPDINLIVAGKGDMYFDIDKYKNLEYISFKSQFIGMQEMVNLFKGAEFIVCPYKDATQSGVVQTAFSMSVPVLASAVGALPSCIENDITGILVPPCDSDALAKKIIHLHKSPNILDTMRLNINKIWRSNMSWKPIAKDYLKIYNNEN